MSGRHQLNVLGKRRAPVTGDRFTIKHPDVFFEAINNSSENR